MKLPLPKTIQARLVLSHLFVSLASITLISIYAGNVLYNAVRRQVEHRYEDLAFAATNELEKPLVQYLSGEMDVEQLEASIAHLFATKPEVHYTLYLPDGRAVFDNLGDLPGPANPDTAPELWDAMTGATGEGEYIRLSADGGEHLFLAVRIAQDDQVYGVLRLDLPLQTALVEARRSLILLVASAAFVSLAVSAIGLYLARNIAVPIENLTKTAENISRGQLGARVIAPDNPQEIHRLAEAFNEMAARMQAHVHELRIFVANASHELRTPLTSIKLRVEALRNGALDDLPVTEQFLSEVESEVDRLSSMVNDMLDLSRIEAGMGSSERTPLSLAAIVDDVYETFYVRAERAEIDLVRDVEPQLPPILGNEDQLRRMLYNLVDNAVKYTPCNGQVRIRLYRHAAGNTLRLQVEDSGFGIAKNHLPHIFERFYRVEATRPRFGPPQGSGLGLAIAKSIVELHGGTIGVSSEAGKGTTFSVDLPVPDSNSHKFVR